MWKCPRCGQLNRENECVSCGIDHSKNKNKTQYLPSLSTGRFLFLVILSLLFIIIFFTSVDSLIDSARKKESEALTDTQINENHYEKDGVISYSTEK